LHLYFRKLTSVAQSALTNGMFLSKTADMDSLRQSVNKH